MFNNRKWHVKLDRREPKGIKKEHTYIEGSNYGIYDGKYDRQLGLSLTGCNGQKKTIRRKVEYWFSYHFVSNLY